MSDIFDKRVTNVEKIEELDNGFDLVRITFEDGDSVEAAAKYIFRKNRKSQ